MKVLNVGQKIILLKKYEKTKLSLTVFCKENKIAKSTFQGILKVKDSLLNDGGDIYRKRKREGKHADLEDALSLWVKQKNDQGVLPSNALIAAKAVTLARMFQIENFTAGDSWMRRFKSRHNIKYRRQHGEKQHADEVGATNFLNETLPELLRKYEAENIYNADETGLYWRGLPDRGYSANGEASGMKVPKDRITCMVSANMTGTDKLPLLTIGKYGKPRCFPRDQSKLPVTYKFSSNSWMTGQIYTNWLQNWDRSLRIAGHKVLLLDDNCTAHRGIDDLTNIEVVFLPPNTTSLIQPMDQGIIKCLKGYYRVKLHERMITELDLDISRKATDVIKTVTLLDAVNLISEAWLEVKPETIANCFRHGGFRTIEQEYVEEPQLDVLEDISLPSTLTREELEAHIQIDEDLDVMGVSNDEELVQHARSARCEEEEEVEEEIPSDIQVLDALKIVRSFAQHNTLNNAILSLREVEKFLSTSVQNKKRQTEITSFFK